MNLRGKNGEAGRGLLRPLAHPARTCLWNFLNLGKITSNLR
jgi:hypothetical protein